MTGPPFRWEYECGLKTCNGRGKGEAATREEAYQQADDWKVLHNIEHGRKHIDSEARYPYSGRLP